ncbi:HPr family phosphocarrier protein [Ameyamaea chiangmaiensis]|uniref:HPr family phosphocarrier protein n=1 Tax=Ameyamaea chiangmaiensis TaxID=442969 RepID=A0A850PAP6_9PROT|nr:HPr family phosphocarrier protein [Ameyamaea chiangmaiensis]MBS4075311.1 HPr family phosphocarrier protein [Ameyamaea chiangmaiensis]NVN41597.1 HPr family phosphocarrier protein [Ameyamaea chiangmaiensis]
MDPDGADVLARTLAIVNQRGLHARAAAKLVTVAERFSAVVEVERAAQRVSALSIMGLMMLGAGKGETIRVLAQGWDARDAIDALTLLVEAGFNEDD